MIASGANRGALDGVTVLVTRPHRQAGALCDLITKEGGCAIRFPVLDIVPVEDLAKAANLLHNQALYHWIIFVSTNAVEYALRALNDRMGIAAPIRVAAIGKATADALAEAGVRDVLAGPPPYSSEALLALPEMQAMKGNRCLIVRGRGGRSQLADTLRGRGAVVDYAEVYRRVRLRPDVASLLDRWRRDGVDVVTVFSGEALHNLVAMVGESGNDLLKSTPLIVVSRRLGDQALERGFEHVIEAERAADAAMLEAILNYAMNNRSTVPEETN
jgi:uroporphyrinogen-III synthase